MGGSSECPLHWDDNWLETTRHEFVPHRRRKNKTIDGYLRAGGNMFLTPKSQFYKETLKVVVNHPGSRL